MKDEKGFFYGSLRSYGDLLKDPMTNFSGL